MAAQAQLKRPAVGFLWDHSVQGRAILPGAAMFEMTMAFGKGNAAKHIFAWCTLTAVSIAPPHL